MVTNYENVKSMNLEELADFLCTFTYNTCWEIDTDSYSCDICIARKTCKRGHCGFIDWLKENCEE